MTRWAALRGAALAAAVGAAVGCQSPAIELVIDPPEPDTVTRVGLRVWDAELELVGDFWVPVGDGEGEVSLPWRVPLSPRGGSESRWFLAEIELYDDALCPTRRAVVSGPSSEPGARRPSFEATGLDGCATAFVDPTGGGAGCDEGAPCADLGATLDDVARAGRPEVIYLRGDRDHLVDGPRGLALGDARTGEAGAPLVIRSWPGTGTARLRPASPGPDAVIELCCNVNAARGVVMDGLDVAGGVRFGISINGENAVGNVVRHAIVHDNGLDRDDPLGEPQAVGRNDAAVIAFNGASGTVIEHSILRATGVRGAASPEALPGVGARINGDAVVRGNVIVENAEEGLVARAGRMDAEGNVVCGNGKAGLVLAGPATVTRSSIVRNGAGIAAGDGGEVSSDENVVADNTGDGLAGPIRSEGDWLHGNGDGRGDGDPRLLDPEACLVTLLPDSPLRGAAEGGANLGAR